MPNPGGRGLLQSQFVQQLDESRTGSQRIQARVDLEPDHVVHPFANGGFEPREGAVKVSEPGGCDIAKL